MKLSILIMLLFPLLSFSAGGGSRDPMQLFWGAVLNFGIVLFLILWKGRPAIKKHFINKHETIDELSKRAQTQKFEAQMMLEKQVKENEHLDKTISEIKTKAQEEVKQFEKTKNNENISMLENLKKDISNKVELAKKEVLSKINEELVNEFISKAKAKVAADNNLKQKVTTQITNRL